jgi:hypothetical protein
MSLDENSLLSNPTQLAIRTFDGCLRRKLTEFIQSQNPTHMVTATLFGESSKQIMTFALNDWAIRINRCYLGRRWYSEQLKPKALRAYMDIGQDIRNGQLHAVLLVKPPATADLEDFITRAPSFFAHENALTFPPLGSMNVEMLVLDYAHPNRPNLLPSTWLVEKFIYKLKNI